MTVSAASNISIDHTFGVMFLAVSISSMVYGITCIQTFLYFRSRRSKHDSLMLRYGVIVVVIIDTIHQLLLIHVGYYYLITHFGDPTAPLTSLPWSAPTELIFLTIVALLFNSFLTTRLWRLSQTTALPGLAAVLTVANAGTNIAYAIRGYGYNSLIDCMIDIKPNGVAAISLSIATECVLSVSVAYHLHKARSGLRRCDDFLTKVIILTITTGMLTTPFDVATLIMYVTGYRNLYALLFHFLLAKLYPCSFITTLNIRQYLQNLAIEAHEPESLVMSCLIFEAVPTNVASVPYGPQQSIEIANTISSLPASKAT